MGTVTYIAFKGLVIFKVQKKFRDCENTIFKCLDYEIGTFVLGYVFNYFQFYLTRRPLFLFIYLPALCFSIMATCEIYDYSTPPIPSIGLHERPFIGQVGISIISLNISLPDSTPYWNMADLGLSLPVTK